MDKNIVWRDSLWFSLHVCFLLVNMLFLFRPHQLNGGENKTNSRYFSSVLSGCTLSCGPSSLWNILFQDVCVTVHSSPRFVSYQCMLASLPSYKYLPGCVKGTAA